MEVDSLSTTVCDTDLLEETEPQSKEGILPVATLTIMLFVLFCTKSTHDMAPEAQNSTACFTKVNK